MNFNHKGIIRKMGVDGRITIPVVLRDLLGIELNDDIEINAKNNYIIIKKYEKKSDKDEHSNKKNDS